MKYILLIGVLLIFSMGTTNAQNGKGKGLTKQVENKGKEKASEMKAKGKDKAKRQVSKVAGSDVADKAVEAGDDMVQKGKNAVVDEVEKGKEKNKANKGKGKKKDDVADMDKGHAYGKNKGELSGKEFGQARAVAAKSKNEEKKKEAKASITKGEQTVTKANDKIVAAKKQLEKDFADKKLSKEEYTAKKDKIALIEQKATQLQEELNKGKKISQKSE